jgi:lipopolysaccharide/colanic/teichoic acid biosynthesis glycosyltransferase
MKAAVLGLGYVGTVTAVAGERPLEPSWDESVRLDPRHVENWSLMLDMQILWKTRSAVRGGSGAD